MPLSWTAGAVMVRVDPYFDVARQRAVFDEDLSRDDVLAVQVYVAHTGGGQIMLDPSAVAIEFPDGRVVSPSTAMTVAAKVNGGTGAVIGSGLAFGVLGFAIAQHATETVKANRIEDYARKELAPVTLSGVASAHGFVFFIGPPKLAFREGTLCIPFATADGTAPHVARLRLSGAPSPAASRD
jgi:hypothetical protein